MSESLLKTALKYRDTFGWSIIPVSVETKRPLISWSKYQKVLPVDSELTEWFLEADWETTGLALVTGKLSGIAVIDDDFRNGKVNLEVTSPVKAKTGGGGYHLYFKYRDGVTNRAHINDTPIDIRGEGGYVVIPPSKHKSGNNYHWEVEGDFAEALKALPVIPEIFVEELKKARLNVAKLIGSETGSRNDRLFRFGSKLVDTLTDSELYEALVEMNDTFNPPLPEKEVKLTFDQAMKFKKTKDQNFVQIRDWHNVLADRNEQRELEAIAPSTGYDGLDRILKGFLPGHVYMLTGDTNAGKTSVAANFAERLRLQGKKVLYIALEPGEWILDYLVAIKKRKPFKHLTKEDFEKTDDLIHVITSIDSLDQLDVTLDQIGSQYNLVIIDHIGYFSTNDKNPLQDQANFMKRLVGLSKKHKFAAMPIAHIRKGLATQKKRRSITIDDISGSGAFKQDSTEVIIIQRYYKDDTDEEDPELKTKARLIVAKTKNGRPGSVWIHFSYESPVVLGDDEIWRGEEE